MRRCGDWWALGIALIGVCASRDGSAAVDPALDVYAMPQQLVTLPDGRRMNIFCEGSGSPTVILEAGAGGSTLDWRQVQSQIARTTRVCAYDRAGMGFSDAGSLPRTADAVVGDFEALTQAAAMAPPYVLVAHSLGSYYVRLYADRHPDVVLGMVLVDPSVEHQDARFVAASPSFAALLRKDDASAHECLDLAKAGRLTAASPLFKACTYGYSRDPTFSDSLFKVQIDRRLSVRFRQTLLSETDEMEGADSDELLAARRPYGDMPLIVLTQSPEKAAAYPGMSTAQVSALNALWVQMHDELAALSSNGSNRAVADSGHYIQRDRPDVVIDAVDEVIQQSRSRSPGPADAATPPKTRHLNVEGLMRPARITIDHWGIAHIFAANERDAFFLQGFNAARDRLWQIDLWRKRGLGLLAKSLGPAYVDQDRAARLFLYRGDMQAEWSAYPLRAHAAAEAFVSGLNAYVNEVLGGRQPLPPEFTLTGSTPDHWSADDVVHIRSHGLIGNLDSEVARARVACLAGLDADQLRVKLEPAHVTSIPVGLDPCSIPADVLKEYDLGTDSVRFAIPTNPKSAALLADGTSEGSNNWVVSPAHSATGRPILANDPHRRLSAPSLRYIVHLEAPGLSLIGAGEPALPGVSFGHNGHVAFGLTIFETDQEDLYEYALKPDDPERYRYRATWERMQVVHETIEVKGEAPRRVALRFTRHGPVIATDQRTHRAFAVRSVWAEPGTSPYFASLGLPDVRNWREFLAVRAHWGTPSLNLIYADTGGNIGWAAGARVPVRRNWDGLLPVPGDGRYEWHGFLEGDQLPAEFNPPKGWFATANEMNLPPGYPNEQRKVGFEWANRSRIDRIDAILGTASKISVADSIALQTDSHNVLSGRLIALLDNVKSSEPRVSRCIELLKSWDGNETTASVAATIYETWARRFLAPMTIRRVTPESVHEIITDEGSLDTVIGYLEHPDSRLGPDPRLARQELLLESLTATVDDLQHRFGPDPSSWRWGRVHTMAFAPAILPLASTALRERLAFPTFELPGSGDSPRAASFERSDFSVVAGASVRMVIDVGDWDRSMTINAPGQSADPASRHYADLLAPWAAGSYVPLLYSRVAIEAAAEEVLLLDPASD